MSGYGNRAVEPGAPLDVVVCGGGRTGHLSAVLFKQVPGVRVSLLTSRADVIELHRRDGHRIHALVDDGVALEARLDAVSNDPAQLLCNADVVIITVPAHARPALIARIAPHLPFDKTVYLGAIPGFCGFDWLAGHAFSARENVVIWGMKDVAHTAFELRPGISVRMGGAKNTLYVATHRRETAAAKRMLLAHLRRLYTSPVELLADYLEITMTPGNPIMHSSVIYGLIGPYGQWHARTFDQPLCWWTHCPELGAYFLERCDEESQALCRAIERRLGIDLSSVKPLKQEIIEAYGAQIADQRTMLSVLRTNRAYDGIRAPLVPVSGCRGWMLDREDRAFGEDVAYGLALLVEMARRVEVPAAHMDEIFRWSVAYMGGLRHSALDYFPTSWPA